MPKPDTLKELLHRFTYHKPHPNSIPVFDGIRAYGKDFAVFVFEKVPDGCERSLAFAKIEEAVMWANAAVARNQAESESTAPGFETTEPEKTEGD